MYFVRSCAVPAQAPKEVLKALIRGGGYTFPSPVEILRILEHLREKTLRFSPIANCMGKRGIRN